MNDQTSVLSATTSEQSVVPRRAAVGVLLGLIALVVGGCFGLVEPPGPPHMSAPFRETVHLEAEQPVVVRHLLFEVSPPSRGINTVLTINANRFITETTGEFAENVSLSVRADDPATTALTGSPGDERPGAIFSLTDLCASGCKSGVTVVVRGTSPARPTDDIAIVAELAVTGSSLSSDQSSLGTTLALSDDEASSFDGQPSSVTAHLAQTIAVGPGSPAHIDLHVRVDPKLLTAPLAFPLVGSLTLRAAGDPATHDQLGSGRGNIGLVTFDGKQTGMAPESGAYDIDWIRACSENRACDVPIGIDVTYDPLAWQAGINAAVANKSAPPPPKEFRFTVDALARLEAFDGRELPKNGLTLTPGP